jgi:hypothetical protein
VAKKVNPVIFDINEFYGNVVKLHASTWVDHVLVEHPQMSGYEALVQQVLKDPYEIRRSTLYNIGAAFISEPKVVPAFPEGIRVLVRYEDAFYEGGASSGLVATSYPIDLIGYQRPNLGATIYRKNKK